MVGVCLDSARQAGGPSRGHPLPQLPPLQPRWVHSGRLPLVTRWSSQLEGELQEEEMVHLAC